MPELPEVETVCRDLRSLGLIGKRIESVRVFRERIISAPSCAIFSANLTGAVIASIIRRGKFIVMALDDGRFLLTHLRMTGSFSPRPKDTPEGLYDRVRLGFHDLDLVYQDPRAFGRMWLVQSLESVLGKLGPEPFDPALTSNMFHTRLHMHHKMLKSLLLDQEFLAGLGNIYSDESLFEAGLHPKRESDSLSPEEADRLLTAIRMVLDSSISQGGTSLGDGVGNFTSNGHVGTNSMQLRVYQRTGQACVRCGQPIERIVLGQRGTHFCPQCQTLIGELKAGQARPS